MSAHIAIYIAYLPKCLYKWRFPVFCLATTQTLLPHFLPPPQKKEASPLILFFSKIKLGGGGLNGCQAKYGYAPNNIHINMHNK